ncbi:MAG: penicillin-binding transpeptidase domain-containing protein [Acidimicrobiales bacterium]
MTPELTRFRLRIIAIVGVSLFIALFVRLWFVQVVAAEQAQFQAQENIIRIVREQGPRGRILDRSGKVLVENRLTNVVEIDRLALNEGSPRDPEERDAFQTEMFDRLASQINRSGGRELVKVSTLRRALDDANYTDLEQVPLVWDVSDDLLVSVGERPDLFPGVTVSERSIRHYPYGKYAAHILGWVGRIGGEWASLENPESFYNLSSKPYQRRDEIGKEGIERLFEDQLRGIPGQRKFEVDRLNRIVREFDEERQFPQAGNDIWLTIDIDLQAKTEDELAFALANARDQEPDDPGDPAFLATAGSAVILDPRTGQVLAMASNPTFDISEFVGGIPQDRYESLLALNNPFVNRAVTGLYEPGSTFKPFTAIAAHEFELFGSLPFIPEMDQFIDHGPVYTAQSCQIKGTDEDIAEEQSAAGCRFRNAGKRYNGIDLRNAITESSDTYFYQLGEGFWINEREDDDTAIQDVAERFGFGSTTGIALPSEKKGYVPTPERRRQRHDDNPDIFPTRDWRSGDNIQLAIGQSDLVVTPLQLANAYAALANGGTLFNPNIVASVRAPEALGGEVLREFSPRIAREFEIPADVAERILDGLLGVPKVPPTESTNGGTAYAAFADITPPFPLQAWPVAGKTGTAERIGQADNALFAAFGPVVRFDEELQRTPVPAYVAVAILEEAGFGSRSAAPLIAKIFHAIANGAVGEARTAEQIRAELYAEQSFDSVEAAVEGETVEGSEP